MEISIGKYKENRKIHEILELYRKDAVPVTGWTKHLLAPFIFTVTVQIRILVRTFWTFLLFFFLAQTSITTKTLRALLLWQRLAQPTLWQFGIFLEIGFTHLCGIILSSIAAWHTGGRFIQMKQRRVTCWYFGEEYTSKNQVRSFTVGLSSWCDEQQQVSPQTQL